MDGISTKRAGLPRGQRAPGSCLGTANSAKIATGASPRLEPRAATQGSGAAEGPRQSGGRASECERLLRARDAARCRRVAARTAGTAAGPPRAAVPGPPLSGRHRTRLPPRGARGRERRRAARARPPPHGPASGAGGRTEQARPTARPSAASPGPPPARRQGPGARAPPGRGTYV